ncbi:MAG: putative GntR family transcriptional regulator [Cohnella sp.]|nr:putative GntR family transcriptional regulator [Cohnella sp.]
MSEEKNSSLYKQVKDKLLDAIRSGTYQIGDQLPTEQEFCELYNVSRTTVRLALQQLDMEGRIKKIQGKGTFVVKGKIPHYTSASISSFPEQMQLLGRRAERKVLEATVIPAAPPIDDLLTIPPVSPVTKLARLRIADDEPIAYEVSYIPWHVAPGLASDDCTGSLFKLLREKYGVRIVRSVEALEPVIVNPEIAELLKIETGTPAFLMKTVSYNDNETPVEYSTSYFRNDTSNFIIERHYRPEE